MPFEVNNYLLIDNDSEFSRQFTEHYFARPHGTNPSTLVVAGTNTRQLVKLMFDELIKDYCYCDFSNEISVSELASYLHEHHDIAGVLFNQTDYLLADDKQRFIFNSLHSVRFLIKEAEDGYLFEPVADMAQNNHLSCQTEIAETPQDLDALCEKLNN
ncbi:MAG TPA: hypothetical protein ENH88_11845 [Pseudoalteromonas prydzensis]|uniref:Uncharacterized protein n=1 Tax=Pseudoalteromonas prydzensis TaxID=182141 RepID=A0A7V1CZK3_9GAMM|nr:hypothetical protein [Pseudoalteromonas prydzensis]HEA17114.1 hypothetical protein [Pseudoalteromonas prydzensis]